MTEVIDRTHEAHEVVARAAELVPLLREHAGRADQERRLADEVVEAMIDAGVFRLWTPRRYGGHEADMHAQVEMCAQLGRGCSAAAWNASVISAGTWMACTLPEQGQEEIFADPNARVSAFFSPGGPPPKRVDGGYIVNGSWGFGSGCMQATWTLCPVPLVNDAGTVVNLLWTFIPRSQTTMKDTWFTMGMRGTASNTLTATEVFVPDSRTVPMYGPEGVVAGATRNETDNPLYRVPTGMLSTFCIVGPCIGMARAAMEHVREALPSRAFQYTNYTRQAQATSTQLLVAEAATLLDRATMHAHRSAADCWAAGVAGESPSAEIRTRVRHDAALAIRTSKQAVDALMFIIGASAAAQGSHLERIYRDISTAALHAVARTEVTGELYGSTLSGEEPTASALF